MANMKQIAKKAGVSLGTVSHVLNNTVRVSEPLRKQVLNAVKALGYQPSQLARGLRRDRTNMVGMIIPDVTNPFFTAVVRGAEDVAFAHGHRLILCNTDNDHDKELVHLNALRTYLPAGLLVIPSNFSDLTTQAEFYRKAGAAVVCIDRLPRHWEGDAVTASNEEGVYSATKFLIRLRHRRLAMITGPLHLTNAQDRLHGFRRAVREAKLRLSSKCILETTFDRQGGYTKASILLSAQPRPTAIIAGNDLIAFGVLQAIRKAGLRCPEDVSVIGFDDLELSEMTDPPLTTVHQPGYEMGATGAKILLKRLSAEFRAPERVILDTQLKMRQSVAICKGRS